MIDPDVVDLVDVEGGGGSKWRRRRKGVFVMGSGEGRAR
jgi:hypothetical protein